MGAQDNVTRTLQKLVAEIVHIRKTRAGKATNRTQRDESTKLQILTAEYLREKGAPKVQGHLIHKSIVWSSLTLSALAINLSRDS